MDFNVFFDLIDHTERSLYPKKMIDWFESHLAQFIMKWSPPQIVLDLEREESFGMRHFNFINANFKPDNTLVHVFLRTGNAASELFKLIHRTYCGHCSLSFTIHETSECKTNLLNVVNHTTQKFMHGQHWSRINGFCIQINQYQQRHQ